MSEKEPLSLNAKNAYWSADKPEVIDALEIPPEKMSNEQLLLVVRELDRRFMQLWDKVIFERQHNLVDYAKLKGKR